MLLTQVQCNFRVYLESLDWIHSKCTEQKPLSENVQQIVWFYSKIPKITLRNPGSVEQLGDVKALKYKIEDVEGSRSFKKFSGLWFE